MVILSFMIKRCYYDNESIYFKKTLYFSDEVKEKHDKLISIYHRNSFCNGTLPCDLSYLNPSFKKGKQYIVKSDIQRNNIALLVIDDVSKEDISNEKVDILYDKPIYYIYCGSYGYALIKLRGKMKKGLVSTWENFSSLDLFKMNVTEVYPTLRISRFSDAKTSTFGKHLTLKVKLNLEITAGLDMY